jgi:asparagine synthetase B (glutamine-hydrolysing)
MSAICGIIHFDGKPVEQSDLATMVESSPYRGPDGTGYYVREDRRLLQDSSYGLRGVAKGLKTKT